MSVTTVSRSVSHDSRPCEHAAKAAARTRPEGAKAGHVYLHSAVDGYSRLAYIEHLPNETAQATIGGFAGFLIGLGAAAIVVGPRRGRARSPPLGMVA